MGKSGLKHVIEHYNWSNNVSQMEKVHAQVLKKRNITVLLIQVIRNEENNLF